MIYWKIIPLTPFNKGAKNMKKKVAIIITPNYKDYAKKYLSDCIESVRLQDYSGKIKVFITDNETSAESFQLLNKIAPEAELVLNKTNDGFAKGVNDSIRQALMQDFSYIAVVNIHTTIEPNYISELVKAAESDEKIGVVQARMMLDPEKDKISSLGNTTHFLGFGYCMHYKEEWEKIKNEHQKIENIFYPSGSSMFFKREILEKVGLLDEEYWMYNEDQEIGWRIWLAGYRCVLAPNAVMYNKYEFQRSIKKFYWMDRNRINATLQCYRLPTLLLILPACILMELGLILFSIKTGWFKEKIRVWKYFLTPSKWIYIFKARKRNQALRKIGDKDIVKMITGKIWYQEVDDAKLRLVNPIFNAYWKLVKSIIIW
jgi:GT2 family glycosyltransferase